MLLSGKEPAEKIIAGIKDEIGRSGLKPKLGIIVVGDYKPSHIYAKRKMEAAKRAGIEAEVFMLGADASEGELLELIKKLNNDGGIDGYIVQLPLPKHINTDNIVNAIDPEKDVDCFHPSNFGKVALGMRERAFEPATPSGIMHLLEYHKIPIAGANVVIVGRSNIVGKPVALMFLHKDASVTVCHSKTRNLGEHTKKADILVVAAGSPGLIKSEMVKEGAYVIDVGTTRFGEKVVGDVESEVQKKAHLSPVPGGVGPLTVAMLLENTLKVAKMRGKW